MIGRGTFSALAPAAGAGRPAPRVPRRFAGTVPAAEALQPFRPGLDGTWDRAAAAHLSRRAGFGASAADADRLIGLEPTAAAADLLRERTETADARFAGEVSMQVGSLESAQASWVYRMLYGASPGREKLALFWHGHFATSERKVEDAGLMQRQAMLFRAQGAGPFGDLLLAVSKDPAMLVWLDGNSNRRGKPNENFSRELMELFSLGIGNYTEADIKEAARAFTGWHVKDGEFWFNERAHDREEKRVFGKQGNLRGEEVVTMCAGHPASAEFIASKLFEFYVHPGPSLELRRELAGAFSSSGGRTGEFLIRLLSSRVFYGAKARRAIVSTPADFAVGSLRTLEARASTKAVARAMAAMGQELFAPPSVKGWDMGHAWLNSTTLLARYGFAAGLCGLDESPDSARALGASVPWERIGGDPGRIAGLFFPEGLAGGAGEDLRSSAGDDPKVLVAACLQMPEYQFI